MKKFLLAALLFTTVTQAAEVKVLLDLPGAQVIKETGGAGIINTKFRIDFNTQEVFADLTYSRSHMSCSGTGDNRMCSTETDTVKTYSAKVEGMSLFDKKMMLQTVNGEVECGEVRPGRIFRNVKNLILNGNCDLDYQYIVETDGKKHVQVLLLTK